MTYSPIDYVDYNITVIMLCVMRLGGVEQG